MSHPKIFGSERIPKNSANPSRNFRMGIEEVHPEPHLMQGSITLATLRPNGRILLSQKKKFLLCQMNPSNRTNQGLPNLVKVEPFRPNGQNEKQLP